MPTSVETKANETQPSQPAIEAPARKPGRISALDFTKGFLVLVMVLYHWLNYFFGPQGFYYVYLRFLPPSFICITGFLIAQVYLSKYRVTDARLPRRLATRGLKLLGVFVALNLLPSLLSSQAHTKLLANFAPSTLLSIYVTGNFAGQRLAAFTILVPIAYLLILSAGLTIACRSYKYIFHVASALFLASTLGLSAVGENSGILELLTIGLIGISIGYISIDKINAFLRHPYILILAYGCYLVAITTWNTPYPLEVAGVCLTLLLIYGLGTISGDSRAIPRSINLLGKYSLLGYIAQIAVLQVLRAALRHVPLGPAKMVGTLVAAVGLTFLVVELTDRARARAPIANSIYVAIFG